MEKDAAPVPDPKLRSEEGRLIESKDIFGSGKTVLIRHDNGTYRLMITKQGKLILTK